MACNYRHLGDLHRARRLLDLVYKEIEKLPNSLSRNLIIQQFKEAEVYMDKLEEDYRNE